MPPCVRVSPILRTDRDGASGAVSQRPSLRHGAFPPDYAVHVARCVMAAEKMSEHVERERRMTDATSV